MARRKKHDDDYGTVDSDDRRDSSDDRSSGDDSTASRSTNDSSTDDDERWSSSSRDDSSGDEKRSRHSRRRSHPHKFRRRRSHGFATGAGRRGGSSPGHHEVTLIGCIVVGVIVLLSLGAWYVYSNKDGSTGSGTGSAGSTGSGSSSGSGSGDGSWGGTAGTSGSSATSSKEGGGGAGGSTGSATASGGASGGAGSESGTSTSSGAAATSTGGGSSSSGGSGGSVGGGKVSAFFENWVGQDPSTTDFSGLYAAYWFTAVPEAGGSIMLGESTEGQAKTFAETAQKAGAKAMLTVGGWSGSALFTTLVASKETRSAFIDAMADALDQNSFDGIDIDWEYPGKAGDTQDFDVENDLANLILLLQELREKIGSDKLISADTSAGVYLGADGNPSTDLSEFADALDWITIMTYDSITYSSRTTGPNFAFSSKCAPATGSYEIPTTVQAWIDAKFPAEKISLGLASYGYAWEVDDFKDGGGVDGASSSIYQTSSKTLPVTDGSVKYNEITSDSASTEQYVASMDYTFDDCTSTPFLYSSDTKLFIAYDDEKSFGIKGGYSGEIGLFGCSVYAALTQDSSGKLIKAAIDAC
ncbi:hypothetical protein JCM10212_000800 [Sporobolomyces blumeae]